MRAIWNDTVIAESDKTLVIEGNQYFPPDSIKKEYFMKNDDNTTCPWKGLASYYDVIVNGDKNPDAAWYYPDPKKGSAEIVAKDNNGNGDFANYVAFWNGVEVKE